MHPDGWLRRRSTRFHGIKDSALNPRDCRGCVEGREGQREGDRASARSERGQWSRRRRKGAGRVLGFWVRSAPRSSEEGCSVRRMWNSRSAHSVTPAAAYPSSVHTPWCDTYDPPILPPFSLSLFPSFFRQLLSLSLFLLSASFWPIALPYATLLLLPIAWNVVRDWRSFSRFLGGLELYIREEEEEERFYTDDKTKEEVGCLLVSLVRECRWSSRLLTSTNASNSRCVFGSCASFIRRRSMPGIDRSFLLSWTKTSRCCANPHNVTCLSSNWEWTVREPGENWFGKDSGVDRFILYHDFAPGKYNLILKVLEFFFNLLLLFLNIGNCDTRREVILY